MSAMSDVSDRYSIPGVAPDGRRFPVHAIVHREAGRGALLGLALGALTDGERETLEAAMALARTLRDHGQLRPASLAAVYAAGTSPARVAPIALLHAGARDPRVEGVLADAEVIGDSIPWVLTAALTAGAIAAAGWERLPPRDMVASGLDDVEVACQRLVQAGLAAGPIEEARQAIYDDVRSAEQSEPLPAELPAHRVAARVAVFHLLAESEFADAIEAAVPHGAAALTGALVGAARGEAALPEDAVLALLNGDEGVEWRAYAAFGGDPPPLGPIGQPPSQST